VDFGEKGLWREVGPDYPDDVQDDRRCPYGVPGDRLWVRETWAPQPEREEAWKLPEHEGGGGSADDVCYRADERPNDHQLGGLTHGVARWRPSIYMPRFASRITLEVTDVRADRLQDITEEDAKAEGVERQSTFRELWDGINGKRAPWSSNPFVWVVGFRRVT
jgi:hypothetical protein